ncbi:sigma-70 family RNA polymerase sigma factor [Streptomyces sp. bgisy100]|uniref:sigma-70 family RNA polymerase sigma factor n=1 Tax=Streptomyces sp. bgisy100 TaxID=3413783 RepID=UPI003D721A6E
MSTFHQKHSFADWPDEELATSLRRGETAEGELAELYERHRSTVRAYAGTCCHDPNTAEDLTSEAFIRTIEAVRAGHGPRGPWRPYLLTVVRNTAINWGAAGRRTELSDTVEDWADERPGGEESALRREEDGLVLRSFRQLPERWQTVLWHTVVEREPVSRVAPMLGISESGVSSLAERAREGLREAYLSVHVSGGNGDEGCGRYSGPLAAAVRRPGRRTDKDLARHLSSCANCRRAMTDLLHLNSRLRTVLPTAFLLGGGAEALGPHVAAGNAATLTLPMPSPLDPSGGASAGPMLLSQKGLGAAAVALALSVSGFVLLGPDQRPVPPRAEPQRTSLSHRTAPRPETPASRPPPPPSRPAPRASRSLSLPLPSATGDPGHALHEAWRTALRNLSTGRCLEAGSAAGGVREADCDSGAHQSWIQLHHLGGTVLLRNEVTRLCLRASSAERAQDGLRRCDSRDSRQVWRTRFSPAAAALVVIGGNGRTYETE